MELRETIGNSSSSGNAMDLARSQYSLWRVSLALSRCLSGNDGIDALARLRQLAPNTGIVILTVFEEDEKIFRAIRSAAAGGSPIYPTIARRVLNKFSKVSTNAPHNIPNRMTLSDVVAIPEVE